MAIKNFLKPSFKNIDFYNSLSTKSEFQKSIQVCILGGGTRLGMYTSFLMKQNPLISTLHIQGCFPIENNSFDLNFMDTRCNIQSYCGGEDSVSKAVRSADVVLILPTEDSTRNLTLGERVMKEGKRLYNMAVQCSLYAPRAILVVAVPPVSITTPLVSEVFKKTNFYHPGRIVGSAASAQIKANTLVGRYQDLDPNNCNVPLLGGPDNDLAVPLFSQARPVEVLGQNGPKNVTAKFRGVKIDEFPKKLGDPNWVEYSSLSDSYALNQLISTIALGICGDPMALANVYLRSTVVSTCKYFVSTIRFSRGGVVDNYGMPMLSPLELELVEKAALQLKEREQMALDYLKFVETEDDSKAPPFAEKEKQAKELLKKSVIH